MRNVARWTKEALDFAAKCADLWRDVPEEYRDTFDGQTMLGCMTNAAYEADLCAMYLSNYDASALATRKSWADLIKRHRDRAEQNYNTMILTGDNAND